MAGKEKKINEQVTNRPYHRRRWVQFTAILLTVFAVYGNSISNDYNLDDVFVVPLDASNPVPAEGISAIPKLLISPYNDVEGLSYAYRPLGKVSMAIEYELWGNNPHCSHVVNLVLYALNIFVLLLFLERVAQIIGFRNFHVLYIGLLIFLVHPIHTEVVCSIKNREEIMSFTLMILALLCYLQFMKNNSWWYVLSFIVLVVMALLAKQTALNIMGLTILLVVCQAYMNTGAFFKREIIPTLFKWKGLLYFVLSFAVVFFVFQFKNVVVGSEDVEKIASFETNPYFYTEGIKIFPIAAQTVGFYLKKLFFPYPLLYYYGYDMLPVVDWNDAIAWTGLVLLIALLIWVIYGLSKNKNSFTIFWVLFFLITIFPFSNVGIFFIVGIVGERLAYQASFGFAMLIALGIVSLAGVFERKVSLWRLSPAKGAWLIAVLLSIPMVVITIDRNTDWKDRLTLFEADIKHLSKSARANVMIANRYMTEVYQLTQLEQTPDRMEEARHYVNGAGKYLNEAITIYPKFQQAWFDLGRIQFIYIRDIDSAMACLSRVDEEQTFVYAAALNLLGDIHAQEFNEMDSALAYYIKAYFSDPSDVGQYMRSARMAFELQKESAMYQLADTALNYEIYDAYAHKADALFVMGDTLNALKNYRLAWNVGIRNEHIQKMLSLAPEDE